MRVPKHHLITQQDGQPYAITTLNFRANQPIMVENCQVDGVGGNAWIKAVGEDDYLFLFGTISPQYMGQTYRKRWTIGTIFQNLKSRGFDLATTHLPSQEKLKKLLGFCSLAYGLCLSMGVYLHKKVQIIKTKKNGYKKTSFSRHGRNFFQQLCRPATRIPDDAVRQLTLLQR